MPADGPDGEQDSGWPARRITPELRQRIVWGLAIAALALAVLYWSPTAFVALTVLIAAIMGAEWGRIVRGGMPDAALIVHVLAVVMAGILSATDMAGLAIAAAVLGAIAVAAITFDSGKAQLSGLGVLYTSLPVIALSWLRSDEPLGFPAALFVLLSVVETDIAAFFTGRALGGPKLWPEISPNKTWSGLIGGVSAAAVGGGFFALLSGTGASLWLACLGLVMGLVAQVGDLAESALKRHFGLKDAGDLIPGHGGFMDRMDGIVTASIVAALIAFAIDAFAPARALLYGS